MRICILSKPLSIIEIVQFTGLLTISAKQSEEILPEYIRIIDTILLQFRMIKHFFQNWMILYSFLGKHIKFN